MTMVLTSHGFGPRDVQLKLDDLNLIVGPVHTGKSTILNMIRFAVLGYVPSIGKLDAIVARHMVGDRMEVSLEIPDGRLFTRELVRDGDGFTKRLTASWLNGKLRVVHPQVLERFGSQVDLIEQHLDQTTFLSLSPDMRARTIDGMLAEGSTPEELGEQCAKHIVLKLMGIAAESAPADWRRELIPRLSKTDRALLAQYQPELKALLRDSGVGAVVDTFSKKVSEEDKRQRERRSAADELQADAADLGPVQDDEIAELERTVSGLDQKIGAWNANRPDLAEHDRKVGQLQRELAALEGETNSGATDEQRKALEAARKKLDEARRAFASVGQPETESLTEQIQKIDAATREIEKIEELKNPNAPTDDDIRELTEAHTAAESKVRTIERSPWGEVTKVQESLTTKAAELKGRKGMGEIREFLTEHAMTLARHCGEQAKKLEAARAEMDGHAARLEELSPPWKIERDRAAQEQQARAKLDEARQGKAEIEARNKKAREAYDAAKKAVDDASAEVSRINREIAEADEAAATRVGRLAAKREEIEKLKAPEDPGEPTDLQTARDEAGGKLSALRDTRSKLQQIEQKRLEIETAQARRTVLVAFREAAKRVAADEATRKRAPLVSIMKKFFDDCGIADEPFFELGGENPMIGVQRVASPDGDPALKVRTVDVSVLSGHEWGIFTAGLNIAMQQLREVPVKVIPIEGGEVEGLGPDIVPLMRGLRANRHLFDCCLLTCHGIPRDTEGWNVIDVQKL